VWKKEKEKEEEKGDEDTLECGNTCDLD